MVACFCRGGESCCINQNKPSWSDWWYDRPYLPTGPYGPHKCPDCEVWWSGLEHRCQRPNVTIDTSSTSAVSWCIQCGGMHSLGQHGSSWTVSATETLMQTP